MGLFDILRQFLNSLLGQQSVIKSDNNNTPNTPQPTDNIPKEGTAGISRTNRFGTFIIPDIYPLDPTGQNPPFSILPGLKIMDKEVVGCYIKASQGLDWGITNETWFIRNWKRMAEVAASTNPEKGEFHRGTYHFLIFQQDGAKQADYFCNLIEQAGGWKDGDLMPWVDVEAGGQGFWAGGIEDLSTLPAQKKTQLANDVRTVTTSFVKRVKERFPGIKVGLYGRGIFRDLGMTDCVFGCDAACNPAYTAHPPDMSKYGWPLAKLTEWQLCGDGTVAASGFPSTIPGWGKTDYSAYINGALRTGLKDFYSRALAFDSKVEFK